MSNPIVTIEMENGKKIVAELYPRHRSSERAEFHLPRQRRFL